jgi:YVTN family beta-propeller protein
VIDCATTQVIATVTAGEGPCALCHNPQNNKVYCANSAYNGTVTVIDGATNGVLTTIEVGDRPWAFARNPAQNRVYVANHESSSISVLRDSGGGIEETMNDERGMMNTRATIVRGALFVQERASSSHKPQAASLLDAAGRKVFDLKSGANDVRSLVPGVYFVRAVSGKLSAASCQKVIVTR